MSGELVLFPALGVAKAMSGELVLFPASGVAGGKVRRVVLLPALGVAGGDVRRASSFGASEPALRLVPATIHQVLCFFAPPLVLFLVILNPDCMKNCLAMMIRFFFSSYSWLFFFMIS
jgi:hypothetical protein